MSESRIPTYIERFDPSDLLEEYEHYSARGRTALICARPDIINYMPYQAKEPFVDSYVDIASTENHVPSHELHRACAHLAIELYRGAYLVALKAAAQLPIDTDVELRRIVLDSRLADDMPVEPTDLYHAQIRALNLPTHADAPSLRPPPDTPRYR